MSKKNLLSFLILSGVAFLAIQHGASAEDINSVLNKPATTLETIKQWFLTVILPFIGFVAIVSWGIMFYQKKSDIHDGLKILILLALLGSASALAIVLINVGS